MAQQRLIVAIGRIERALSRLEKLPADRDQAAGSELAVKYEKLKAEAKLAIAGIDEILGGSA